MAFRNHLQSFGSKTSFRRLKALAIIFFLSMASFLPQQKSLANDEIDSPPSSPVKSQFAANGNQDVLIEITDSGIQNPNLMMRVRQGVVFFMNNTSESLLTLEIDFGKNALACFSSATPNLKFADNGKLLSTRPIAPGSFASTCLPTLGTFPFTVYGLKKNGVGTTGMITVSY